MRRLLNILSVLLCQATLAQSGPNDGTSFSNVPVPGSSASWNNPTNAQTSDATYTIATPDLLSNGDFTDLLEATGFGFAVPGGATIDGIVVEVEKRNTGSKDAKDANARIIQGGTVSGSARALAGKWPTVDTYLTYGSNVDLWGLTWTTAQINAANFGFAIAAKRTGGGGGNTIPEINHIRVTVYFTPSPMPIQLLSFQGSAEGSRNLLSWDVATQTNNNYFTLDKSSDALNWEFVCQVNGAGTTSEEMSYSCADDERQYTRTYYRLTQTDFDGKHQSFNIIDVANSYFKGVISVHPNPVISNLIVEIGSDVETVYTLRMMDSEGRVQMTQDIQCQVGINEYDIDVSGLAKGFYMYEIVNRSYVHTGKLIKTIWKTKSHHPFLSGPPAR